DDPESFYVSADAWAKLGPLGRGLLWAMSTLAGRMVLGPWFVWARLILAEWARLCHADSAQRLAMVAVWSAHGLAVGIVLAWVLVVAGMGRRGSLLCFVYPGPALTLLRSFTEHRPSSRSEARTQVVESRLFGLLFLNNNLHVVHHREPGLAWYRIPAEYRRR